MDRPVCRLTATLTIKLSIWALLVAAPPAQAAEDIVLLTTGNRMTGEIIELNRGELTFSIAGARRVDIDWANVETLQSTQTLDVELASGERLSGALTSPSTGKAEVATDAGPKAIELKDVIRITPIQATWRDRTRGSVDLGFDFLTAHNEIDWTFNATAENRTKNYLTEASLSSLVRRHDSETAQQRNHLEVASRRFLANRWFALGLLGAEENRELDLDLRVLVGAAMGRTLVQSNRSLFAVYGGLDLAHEEFSGVSENDDNIAEALAAVEWDLFDIGGDTELLLKATTYFGLDDGRVRVDLNSSLRHDITTNYYLSLNLYESYNSDPPPGLKNSDLGVSITFGRSF